MSGFRHGLVGLSVLGLGLVSLAAGPYAPAAGQPGSTAVSKNDPRIIGWATVWRGYAPGANATTTWQTPEKALGAAVGDSFDIVCLGDQGQITMGFDGVIQDGSGPDFAVFENSFSDTFLELGFVEVSSDGVHFFRFPNRSLTPGLVSGFGTVDPTNVDGLAGKYRQGYGTPFDLADLPNDPYLDKNAVRFVRVVDIVGNGSALDSTGAPIYDPHPTSGSAGFDLDAVAVLHGTPSATWKAYRLPDFSSELVYRSPQFAVLPDGRMLFAQGGHANPSLRFRRQEAFGSGKTLPFAVEAAYDPSFLAVRDGQTALLGAGGWGASAVATFDPTVNSPTLSPLGPHVQTYSAAWWQNPAPAGASGWLLGGTNDSQGRNGVRYRSADGATDRPVVENISTYSGGMTVDAAGNLYVATYELEGPKNRVYRFTAAQVEATLSGSPLTLSQGEFLFAFQGASSLAVDGLGRLWAAGWELDGQIQGYDLETGASTTIAPQHPPLTAPYSTGYALKSFSLGGVSYLAALARDPYDLAPELYYLTVEAAKLVIPHTVAHWRARHFGSEVQNPALESSRWGDLADPEGDGLPNLLEFAFGGNPLAADAAEVSPQSALTGQRVAIVFPRDERNVELTYVVEASSTLAAGSWQTLATSVQGAATTLVNPLAVVEETGAGSRRWVTVRDAVEIGPSQPRRFLRVRVQRAAGG